MKSMSKLCFTFYCIFVNQAFAQSNITEQSTHLHGEVVINISKDSNILNFHIISPGINILSFEDAPKSTEQITRFSQALIKLNQAFKLIKLPKAANCSLINQNLVHTLSPDEAVTGYAYHEDFESRVQHQSHTVEHHSSFNIKYGFQCNKINELKSVDINWYKHFPSTKTMRVHISTEQGLRSSKLLMGSSLIKF